MNIGLEVHLKYSFETLMAVVVCHQCQQKQSNCNEI